ncbi:nucleotide disphospho-sugar-binding domain-containing protein [Kutzneria sp. NPDC052558]|uniref:nucleotide disphospho-sugar-binding domain-containing protein n=1 Tax=Kutzneria sp. NPDC052558 TaxID=3364121 RepID=UPI0037CC87D1
MRVLFHSAPAYGHVFPMIPLAWALRAAGHEVVFASYEGAEPIITPSGLPWRNIAPGVQMYHELFNVAAPSRPDLMRATAGSLGRDRVAFCRLFAHVNDVVADGLVEFAQWWQPDLVVYEYISPVGLIAAGKLGVPAVQHDLGLIRTAPLRAAMLEELAPTFERHGVEVPTDVRVLDIAPPSLIDGEPDGWSLRPVSYSAGGELPDWLARPAERPLIALTVGTVSPRMGGLDLVRRVIETAPDVDADFVLALGQAKDNDWGELPPNVRVAGWVPWNSLLRVSSAAIHHGGSGTSLAVLEAGLPQLITPDGSDRDINAEILAGHGAALTAGVGEVDADLLARLVADETLAKAAREVRQEIAEMPSPASLVPELAGLAG